jgi:hypothetical protein
MSEEQPTDPADRWKVELEDAPRPKRGVPLWIWGCGGGCLLTMALVIGCTGWAFSSVYKAIGPDKAWPLIAEVLPYGEEPPEGYEAVVFDSELIADSWLVRKLLESAGPELQGEMPKSGHRVFVINEAFDESRGAGSGSRFALWSLPPGEDPAESDPPAMFNEAAGMEQRDREELEVTLQGRTLPAVRYTAKTAALPYGGEQDQQYLELDLSAGRDGALFAKLISTGEVQANEEELNRFLAPFTVWESAPSEVVPQESGGSDG